jgi:hypothetical protein
VEHDLLGQLADWSAEAAAAERTQQRWLEQQALEDVSLAGVLVDLAERGARVAVAVRAGAVKAGVVRMVGADFVVLDNALVPFAAIESVRTTTRVSGSREPRQHALRLVDALARLSAERPRVRVESGGSEAVGSLLAAGSDVLVVAADDEDRTHAFVPIAGIVAVTL